MAAQKNSGHACWQKKTYPEQKTYLKRYVFWYVFFICAKSWSALRYISRTRSFIIPSSVLSSCHYFPPQELFNHDRCQQHRRWFLLLLKTPWHKKFFSWWKSHDRGGECQGRMGGVLYLLVWLCISWCSVDKEWRVDKAEWVWKYRYAFGNFASKHKSLGMTDRVVWLPKHSYLIKYFILNQV